MSAFVVLISVPIVFSALSFLRLQNLVGKKRVQLFLSRCLATSSRISKARITNLMLNVVNGNCTCTTKSIVKLQYDTEGVRPIE